MSTPQAGIFVEGASSHLFLEYRLRPDATAPALRAALSAARRRSVVLALGFDAWRALGGGAAPAELRAFTAIEGPAGRAPATQRDLFVWVQGAGWDACFDTARDVDAVLGEVATREVEQRADVYHDSRDLTGFIDGSANPKGDKAREAALVPDGPHAGGSFVLTQRWVHDLPRMEALSQAQQEAVIGRTKPDSVELEGDAMPPDSHVSRTDVSSAKILRRSVPYGTLAEHGLYFLAFACDPGRFALLLARMFGTAEDGGSDRLLDYTRPVSGAYWFAPSDEELSLLVGSSGS